jgi:hypothetical protein
MDWAVRQPQVRSDIRAERAEYEYLFKHAARVLQDRAVRRVGGHRTKEIPITEWERAHEKEAQAWRLLHQARVLSWGKGSSSTTLTSCPDRISWRLGKLC